MGSCTAEIPQSRAAGEWGRLTQTSPRRRRLRCLVRLVSPGAGGERLAAASAAAGSESGPAPETARPPPGAGGEGSRGRRLHGQCYIAAIDDGLVRSDGAVLAQPPWVVPAQTQSRPGRVRSEPARTGSCEVMAAVRAQPPWPRVFPAQTRSWPGRSAPLRYRWVLPRPQRLDCSGAGQRAPPPHRGRGQGAGRARHATGQPRLGRAVTRRRRD